MASTYPQLSVRANHAQIARMSSGIEQTAPQLDVAIFQFAPRLRDVANNVMHVGAATRRAAADLLVTPELSFTGYDVRDDVHTLARAVGFGSRTQEIWPEASALPHGAVLAGAIERADTTVPYNAAVLFQDDVVTHLQRKIYLPTYGMFDEGRYFGRGDRVQPFVIKGWRCGVLSCEDYWHPMLAYLHALQGCHALLVMAAAPGRGAWEGGEHGGFFASSDSWQRIARTYAQLYGIYVIVCNRCGVEGGITFAGESFVVAPDTKVIARAGVAEEILQVELSLDAVASARTPYAHLRDEDASLALRELERITARA